MKPLIEKESLTRQGAEILKISEISRLKDSRGAYTLVIFVPSTILLKIGGLGERKVEKGYYAYTGSALGRGASSLGGRILRHLRKDKRKRWHIDYLLSSGDVEVKAVLIMITEKRIECDINQRIMMGLNPTVPILNFGSSDCMRKCKSHLLYFGLRSKLVGEIAELYLRRREGEVFVLINDEA